MHTTFPIDPALEKDLLRAEIELLKQSIREWYFADQGSSEEVEACSRMLSLAEIPDDE